MLNEMGIACASFCALSRKQDLGNISAQEQKVDSSPSPSSSLCKKPKIASVLLLFFGLFFIDISLGELHDFLRDFI